MLILLSKNKDKSLKQKTSKGSISYNIHHTSMPSHIFANVPIVYVAIVAPIMISTFSKAFLFMLIPDRTAVNIPTTKDIIAEIAIAMIAIVIVSRPKKYPMKNGKIAGNAPKI